MRELDDGCLGVEDRHESRVDAATYARTERMSHTPDSASSKLSASARSATYRVLALNNVITPILTQSYTPIVPLYAVDFLDISLGTLGVVFAVTPHAPRPLSQ